MGSSPIRGSRASSSNRKSISFARKRLWVRLPSGPRHLGRGTEIVREEANPRKSGVGVNQVQHDRFPTCSSGFKSRPPHSARSPVIDKGKKMNDRNKYNAKVFASISSIIVLLGLLVGSLGYSISHANLVSLIGTDWTTLVDSGHRYVEVAMTAERAHAQALQDGVATGGVIGFLLAIPIVIFGVNIADTSY